ncbi:hypothetical protein ACQPXB_21700 [Amycolatopsis sp. CA-161197]|uniref:hypothetical protein n=1 Tax=Amycolatopsis sp. CA-161197 TaxID=3239922 RepID=UPI003D8B6E43
MTVRDHGEVSGQSGNVCAPRSIADLERDPAWDVAWSPTTHQWVTADHESTLDGRHVRIGLTPARDDLVALIVWIDGRVVHHRRGVEPVMCDAAWKWTRPPMEILV